VVIGKLEKEEIGRILGFLIFIEENRENKEYFCFVFILKSKK